VVVSSSVGAADLVDVIRSLPQDQLEAFVLVRVMGYSYDEAASIIGCPRGTVQSRVARARLRLVEALREELPSTDEPRGVKSGDRAGRVAG
jgi:RNA polymerase sigma-70 factor (ECF subfamily)